MNRQKILQVLETGCFPNLLFFFDQAHEFNDKYLFSQILVNMCLAHEREANKMVKAGLIKSLVREINESAG